MERLKILLVSVPFVIALQGCSGDGKAEQSAGQDAPSEIMYENASVEKLQAGEYVEWVRAEANGLLRAKNIDDLNFRVQYKPYDYIICMEERSDAIHDSLAQRKRKELEGMVYFDLKISLDKGTQELLRHDLSSSQEYNQRVKYFAFEMQNDIQLVKGNDTLSCDFYHFERTYGVGPECTMLIGFSPAKADQKEMTLLVYDRTFHKGLLKFRFEETTLQNIPKLETL